MRRIKFEPVPLAILCALVALIGAVIFFAPAENADAALSGTSILGLIVQAFVKSAISVEREDR